MSVYLAVADLKYSARQINILTHSYILNILSYSTSVSVYLAVADLKYSALQINIFNSQLYTKYIVLQHISVCVSSSGGSEIQRSSNKYL